MPLVPFLFGNEFTNVIISPLNLSNTAQLVSKLKMPLKVSRSELGIIDNTNCFVSMATFNPENASKAFCNN